MPWESQHQTFSMDSKTKQLFVDDFPLPIMKCPDLLEWFQIMMVIIGWDPSLNITSQILLFVQPHFSLSLFLTLSLSSSLCFFLLTLLQFQCCMSAQNNTVRECGFESATVIYKSCFCNFELEEWHIWSHTSRIDTKLCVRVVLPTARGNWVVHHILIH